MARDPPVPSSGCTRATAQLRWGHWEGGKQEGAAVIKDGKAIFAAFPVQHKIRVRLRGWLLAIRLWQHEK